MDVTSHQSTTVSSALVIVQFSAELTRQMAQDMFLVLNRKACQQQARQAKAGCQVSQQRAGTTLRHTTSYADLLNNKPSTYAQKAHSVSVGQISRQLTAHHDDPQTNPSMLQA